MTTLGPRKWCVKVGAITILVGCSTGNSGPFTEQPASDAVVGPTAAQPSNPTPNASDSERRLQEVHPGARLQVEGNRVRRIFGRTVTSELPEVSAANFLRGTAAALGVEPEDLVPEHVEPADSAGSASTHTGPAVDRGIGLMYNPATGQHKFRLHRYQQRRDGIPVYGASLRTLVRVGGDYPVVWANTELRPVGDFHPEVIEPRPADHEKSLRALESSPLLAEQRLPSPRALTDFSTPTPTVFAGVGEEFTAPKTAMQYTARDANGPGMWTFVADAETGDILHIDSNAHFDVSGSVEARVSLGQDAIGCAPLGVVPMPYVNVSSSAGDVTADAAGNFDIEESGSGTVTVTSDLEGEYFVVQDPSGTNSISLNVTPPGPASFLHEDPASPPERVLAQLNAYKQANEIRDMLLDYVPEYPAIAGQAGLPLNVNVESVRCDSMAAWYYDATSARSLNFCPSSEQRANGAYGSIVHHEFGHHIVDSGGSEQGEYGEGMGDTVAMLFSKDPRMALGYYFDCNEPIRAADNDCQYDPISCSSCGEEIHECGQLLSGTIWDIWQQLDVTEPENSDDIIRSLVFNSVLLHMDTSIDASIAIDLLTLDDDDGLLENGTPHYEEICAGFAAHGMDCPALATGLVVDGIDLSAEGPSGGPFAPNSVSYTLHNVGPEANLDYSVVIASGAPWLSVDNASGSIPLGEFTTVTLSIDPAEAAALADGQYSADVDFVNETTGAGTESRTASLWVNAPLPIFSATFDSGLDGFTPGDELDNLWHQSTACRDSLPGHSAPGSLYYGKDATCDYVIGTPIRHTITSPPIEITETGVVELGLSYYLRTENSPDADHAEILLSADGGPFVVVASNDSGGVPLNEGNAWQSVRFDVSEYLPTTRPTTIEIRLAFEAVGLDGNTKTGFVVDDITVYAQAQASSSEGVLVPALIEAEDYVRYHDTTAGNEGGGCETGDDVDKEVTGDSAGGGCNVGWIDAGEWLEYDISVASAQTFDILTRVASAHAGKSFRIEVDGVDVSGALSVPANGWQSYSDVVVHGIPLSAGEHVLRLHMLTNYINVNYIELSASATPYCGDGACSASENCGSCPEDCSDCSGVLVPALIEAEDYVRYHDTTAGNEGGGCETGDDVDKEVTGDSAGGGCNVGWIAPGEWLEYDITVASAQTFDILTRVASAHSGKSFRIEVDGVHVSGALSVPANGWQSYSDVVVHGIPLSAGEHVLRLRMLTNYINVNYIELSASSTATCGNGTCDASEDCGSCPQDCGGCSSGCTCPSGCDAVVDASVDLVRDGAVDVCYFFGDGAGSYINSWNMNQVNFNGQPITNAWIGSGNYPAVVDGGYYLYVEGDYPWSHIEVRQ